MHTIITDTNGITTVEHLWAHVLFSWNNRHTGKIYVARMPYIKSV